MCCVLHTDGSDFSAPDNLDSLFFPAGSENEATLCFNITILEDLCFEKDHNFSLHINSTEDNVNIGPLKYAEVIIYDNEGNFEKGNLKSSCTKINHCHAVPQVDFTQPEYFVDEDDGYLTVCAVVTSLNCSEVPIWLGFDTQDGSATSELII